MRGMRWGTMVLAAAAFGGACGNDHQSKLTQIDGPRDGRSPFDPIDVATECETTAQCEDGDRCTEDRCVATECVSIAVPSAECCASDVLFAETFDASVPAELELAQLNGAAGWSVVDGPATSAPGSLYFGDPASRTYDKGVQVAGSVTLPPVRLPRDKQSVLSMRLWAAIEPTAEYDLFWVEADVMDGDVVADTVRVLSKRDLPVLAYQGFALVDVALPGLESKVVRLRIRFDSLDGKSNAFEGVYIDDLKVEATCPIPPPCVEDADCATGDPCIASACSEVGCVETNICHEREKSPCELADAPPDCCIEDKDCDDGDPRTLDVCDGASCAHNVNPDACANDVDCDDAEECTVDACDATTAVCGHTGKIGPGCCAPGVTAIADFDRETLQGIYVTDNFETGLFWRTDRTRATSGEFALYCGDPVSQTYASETRVKSSATTRSLSVSKGGKTVLEFDLYKSTRVARNWDVFQVFALRGGALFPLWTSKSLVDGTTNGQWEHIVISLAQYAGTDLQVRFVFDSVDAPEVAFEGVYVDSIEMNTTCN